MRSLCGARGRGGNPGAGEERALSISIITRNATLPAARDPRAATRRDATRRDDNHFRDRGDNSLARRAVRSYLLPPFPFSSLSDSLGFRLFPSHPENATS